MPPEYVDVHRDEPILGTCPYCHLPIYQSDPRKQMSHPHGGRPRAFHSGCALQLTGHELESDLQHTVKLLRELGYSVKLELIRPVR